MIDLKFERGFESVREGVKKKEKLLKSCTNCKYFYKEVGDKEELCQNDQVLEYDMVVDENRVYCILWRLYSDGK